MFIGFLPNLVLSSAVMSPLSVPNFSPIGACIRVLWWVLQSVRKEVEEKNEKKTTKNTKLWPIVFRKCLERFSSNLVCSLPYLAGTSVANLVSIGQGIIELHRCENRVFFLPVNNIHGVASQLLGLHDTLPCILIHFKAAREVPMLF